MKPEFAPEQRPASQEMLEKIQCPFCVPQQSGLALDGATLHCRFCRTTFAPAGDIPSLLLSGERPEAARFAASYDEQRLREGWASDTPGYYEHLPHADITGRHQQEWTMRAHHAEVVRDWIRRTFPDLAIDILDAGGGSGWLAQWLANDGHRVLVTDINAGPHGLAALSAAADRVFLLQAPLEKLPFLEQQFDLVIFNAALHYHRDAAATLWDAWRILRADGYVIVMDSPVYHSESQREAARERTRIYYRQHGMPELAAHYHPLLEATLVRHPYFAMQFLQRDISRAAWLRKRLQRIFSPAAGASFPILVGAPIRTKMARRFFHSENVPRITNRASAIVLRDGKIALMRRQVHQGAPYWVLPGGRIEPHERAYDAARREVREEFSIEIAIDSLFAAYTFLGHRQYVYLSRRFEGELRLGGEELRAHSPENHYHPEWIPLAQLAQLNLVPPEIAGDMRQRLPALGSG